MSRARLADHRADEEGGWSGCEAAAVIEQGGTVNSGTTSQVISAASAYASAAVCTGERLTPKWSGPMRNDASMSMHTLIDRPAVVVVAISLQCLTESTMIMIDSRS
jgi:hypothetical protein